MNSLLPPLRGGEGESFDSSHQFHLSFVYAPINLSIYLILLLRKLSSALQDCSHEVITTIRLESESLKLSNKQFSFIKYSFYVPALFETKKKWFVLDEKKLSREKVQELLLIKNLQLSPEGKLQKMRNFSLPNRRFSLCNFTPKSNKRKKA